MKYGKISFLFWLLASTIIWSCSNSVETGDEEFELVELPDSSRVYLNHNSSVSWDEEFKERKITVEGEVYLSVTKDDQRPFKVITEQGEVDVLGTEFFISARGPEVAIEVEFGTVEFHSHEDHDHHHHHKIKRGQRIVYVQDAPELVIGKAEFGFRIWLETMEVEFSTHGRHYKHPHHYIKFRGPGPGHFKQTGPPPHARGRGKKKGHYK